jgi:hypothetical protein
MMDGKMRNFRGKMREKIKAQNSHFSPLCSLLIRRRDALPCGRLCDANDKRDRQAAGARENLQKIHDLFYCFLQGLLIPLKSILGGLPNCH